MPCSTFACCLALIELLSTASGGESQRFVEFWGGRIWLEEARAGQARNVGVSCGGSTGQVSMWLSDEGRSEFLRMKVRSMPRGSTRIFDDEDGDGDGDGDGDARMCGKVVDFEFEQSDVEERSTDV